MGIHHTSVQLTNNLPAQLIYTLYIHVVSVCSIRLVCVCMYMCVCVCCCCICCVCVFVVVVCVFVVVVVCVFVYLHRVFKFCITPLCYISL